MRQPSFNLPVFSSIGTELLICHCHLEELSLSLSLSESEPSPSMICCKGPKLGDLPNGRFGMLSKAEVISSPSSSPE